MQVSYENKPLSAQDTSMEVVQNLTSERDALIKGYHVLSQVLRVDTCSECKSSVMCKEHSFEVTFNEFPNSKVGPREKKHDIRRLHFTRASERGNISRRGHVKAAVTATSILQEYRRKLRAKSDTVVIEMMNAILLRLLKSKRITKKEHSSFLSKYNGVHPHDIHPDNAREREIFEMCKKVVNGDFLSFSKKFSPSVSEHVKHLKKVSKSNEISLSKAKRLTEKSRCRNRQAGFDQKYQVQGLTEVIKSIKNYFVPESETDTYTPEGDEPESLWTTLYNFFANLASATAKSVTQFFTVTLPSLFKKITTATKNFIVSAVKSLFPTWRDFFDICLTMSAPVLTVLSFYVLHMDSEHSFKLSFLLLLLTIPGYVTMEPIGYLFFGFSLTFWFVLALVRLNKLMLEDSVAIPVAFLVQMSPDQMPSWSSDNSGLVMCKDGVFRPRTFEGIEKLMTGYVPQSLADVQESLKNFSFSSLGLSEWLPTLRETSVYLGLINSGIVATERVPKFLYSVLENLYIFFKGEPFEGSMKFVYRQAKTMLPDNQAAVNSFIEKRTYASSTAVIEQHRKSQALQVNAQGKELRSYMIPFAESVAALSRILPEAIAYRTSTKLKPQPVGIILMGEPGVGKGVFVTRLSRAMADIFKLPYTDPQELIFSIKAGDVRYPGDQYFGQLVAYLDDFGMIRDPDTLVKEMKTLCSFVDTSCRPLDTSSVATKGTVFCTSPLVFATTNIMKPIGGAQTKETPFANPAAFYRRFRVFETVQSKDVAGNRVCTFTECFYDPENTAQFRKDKQQLSESDIVSSIASQYAANIRNLFEIKSGQIRGIDIKKDNLELIRDYFGGADLENRIESGIKMTHLSEINLFIKQSGTDVEMNDLTPPPDDDHIEEPTEYSSEDYSDEDSEDLFKKLTSKVMVDSGITGPPRPYIEKDFRMKASDWYRNVKYFFNPLPKYGDRPLIKNENLKFYESTYLPSEDDSFPEWCKALGIISNAGLLPPDSAKRINHHVVPDGAKPLYYDLVKTNFIYKRWELYSNRLVKIKNEEWLSKVTYSANYTSIPHEFYTAPSDVARYYFSCNENPIIGQIRLSGILGPFVVPDTRCLDFLVYCLMCPEINCSEPSDILNSSLDPFNIANWRPASKQAFDKHLTPYHYSKEDLKYTTQYVHFGRLVNVMELSWFELLREKYSTHLTVIGIAAGAIALLSTAWMIWNALEPRQENQSKFVRKEDPKKAKFVQRVEIPSVVNIDKQGSEEPANFFANNMCTVSVTVETPTMFGSSEQSRRSSKGVMLNDYSIIIPRHILGVNTQRDDDTLYPMQVDIWRKGAVHSLTGEDVIIVPLKYRDICLIGIETKKKRLPGVRSIVDKFVKADEMGSDKFPSLKLLLDRTDDTKESSVRVIAPYEVHSARPTHGANSITVRGDVKTLNGDCGSLYVCSKGSEKQTGKIYGIHVGIITGTDKKCFEPLVFEDICNILKAAFPLSVMNQCLEEKGGLKPLYNLSYCEQASLPSKNSIVPSLVHGEWSPIVTAPSLVNSEPPTPLQIALENFPLTPTITSVGKVELLARDYLRSQLPPPKDEELSDRKIFREGRVLKTASSGFPWYVKHLYKKGDLFSVSTKRENGQDVYSDHEYIPDVSALLHKIAKQIEDGIEVEFVPSIASLKVEVLPLEKIEVKKTRLFYVSSFVWYIVQHVLFSPLLDAMADESIDGISSVGLNVHGSDWALLWARFQHNVKCCDYKYFDKNHNKVLRDLAIEATQDYFLTYFGSSLKVEIAGKSYTWKTTHAVRELICAAYQPFVVGRTVYERRGGLVLNNSGMYLTWYNNCCQNVLINVMFIIDVGIESGYPVTVQWVEKYYQISTHGDDVVDSFTHPDLASKAHPKAFAEYALTHGFHVTSAHKDIPLTESFEVDPMYLKRRPVLVDDVLRAQRTEADILQSLYWRDSRSSITAKEHMIASLESALIDFHHYGRDVYNKWARIFYAKAKEFGMHLRVKSYDEITHMMSIRPIAYGTWSFM